MIGALKQACVTRVLDIREAPYSKREEFSGHAIATALAAMASVTQHIRELGNLLGRPEAARAGHMIAFREVLNAHLDSKAGKHGHRRAWRWRR